MRVVAVFDKNAEQFNRNAVINLGGVNVMLSDDVHTYTDIDELLRNEDFDMADICLPSFLHKEYAIMLMKAGKHVLCEKPMALCHTDCLEMLRVAREQGRRLMIGQCLRFEPSYLYLKECIDTGRFGGLRHMTMERLSEYPTWGVGRWFDDKQKCGGCIIDTHIHDIDMARFILGEPESVSCVAYDNIPHCQIVNSRLFYRDTTIIVDAVWDETRPVPFRMGYYAKFDKASVAYDGECVKVHPNGEEAYAPYIPIADRVSEEIKLFVSLILNPVLENTVNSPESAAESVRLVRILAKSAEHDGIRFAL